MAAAPPGLSVGERARLGVTRALQQQQQPQQQSDVASGVSRSGGSSVPICLDQASLPLPSSALLAPASPSTSFSPGQLPAAALPNIDLDEQDHRRPRFQCPVTGCISSYARPESLMTHVENAHLASVDGRDSVPESFLRAYQRWSCCGRLWLLGKACRTCKQVGPRTTFCRAHPGELPQTSHLQDGADPAATVALPVVPNEVLARTSELLACSAGTLKHIPKQCRRAWGDAYAATLQRLHERLDVPAAWGVTAFPRLTLGALSRGGKRHNRQAVNVVMERIQMWQRGEYSSLLSSALSEGNHLSHLKQKKANAPPMDYLPPGVRRSVVSAAYDGALSKAASMLISALPPLADPKEAESSLRALHPTRSQLIHQPLPESSVAKSGDPQECEIESSAILKATRSFPPGSTGGPSGLRPSHIAEALKADDAGELAQALAIFATDFVNGRLPEQARGWFCGARMIGIPKKPSGVRPIAVGETLRRLSAKCLVEQAQSLAAEVLFPQQMGVDVPQAAEILAHGIRAQSARPDEVVLFVDFSNAYNTLDRQCMLNAIATFAPQFLRYAWYCYGSPSPLVGRGFLLESSEGTQQGDVCGPLFFAVTLKLLLDRHLKDSPTGWSRWYLDDGTLCGHRDTVAAMFEAICKHAPEIGLRVNPAKCKVWGPHAAAADWSVPVVPWDSGVNVLGVPVGSRTFVAAECASVISKLSEALRRLPLLADSFVAFHLLRSCLSACRVTHLLRALSFDSGASLADQARRVIKDALNGVVGAPLSEQQWALASLPTRLGGLGVLDPSSVQAAAHLSSFLSTSMMVISFRLPRLDVSHGQLVALAQLTPSARAWTDALRPFLEVGLPLNVDLSAHTEFKSWCEQKNWADAQHNFSADILSVTLSPRLSHLRELSSGAHASSWLTAPSPLHPTLHWRSSDWQLLLRWRLGMPLPVPRRCVACGQHQDFYGDHALCCKAMGVYARHNNLRQALTGLVTRAGFACQLEVALPGTNLIPADVFVPTFVDGFPAALDVAVTHPLHPSAQAPATVVTGAAAEARASAKVAYYESACQARSWSYTAFVAETTGAVNQAGQRLVRKLIRQEALHSGEDPADLSARSWHLVSSAVARAVGSQLVKACAPEWLQPVGPSSSSALPPPSGPSVLPPPPGPSSLRADAPPFVPPAALPSALAGCGPAAGDLVLAYALCS